MKVANCALGILTATIFALITTSTVLSQGVTGLMMLDACGENDYKARNNLCSGYVIGATEMHRVFHLYTGGSMYCAPENFVHKQGILLFNRFLSNNPDKLHEPAIALFILAMRKAYPCKKERQ